MTLSMNPATHQFIDTESVADRMERVYNNNIVACEQLEAMFS